MIDGTKYVSKIKVSLEQPVALDPTFFGTRRDLNQFYPQPLGIAGGNVRKATANADSSAKVSPALGALLPAEVNIYQKEFEKAETILGNIKSGNDERLIENLPSASSRFGFSMIAAEKSDKAIGLFERVLQIDRKFRVHYRLGIAH